MDMGGERGAGGFHDRSSDCLEVYDEESGVRISGGVSGMGKRYRRSV